MRCFKGVLILQLPSSCDRAVVRQGNWSCNSFLPKVCQGHISVVKLPAFASHASVNQRCSEDSVGCTLWQAAILNELILWILCDHLSFLDILSIFPCLISI